MSKTIAYPFDDRARTLCPGLRVDAVLHRTDKAVLLAGVLDDIDVVAKLLIDTDPFWQTKFTAEIDTYRAFEKAPPPVPAPRLLAADPDAGVLVVTRLPGDPVARDRYPTTLWLLLGQMPAARRDAAQLAGDSVPQQAGFWANTATLCVRELRTHGELPDGPLRAARLPYLRATWDTVRARVHALAGRL